MTAAHAVVSKKSRSVQYIIRKRFTHSKTKCTKFDALDDKDIVANQCTLR